MIGAGTHWTQKPPPGTPLDASHPAAGPIALFYLLAETTGTVVSDSGPYHLHATTVGGITWVPTAYGPSFATTFNSTYAKADAAAALFTAPPFWIASFAIIPSGNTTGNTFVSLGYATNSTTNVISIVFTNGSTTYNLRDSATTNASFSVTGTTYNDGLPHLFHGRSMGASDHRLAVDGKQIGTGSTTVATFAPTQFTIGASRTNTVGSPAKGSILWAAGGPGVGPDPLSLYESMYAMFATPWLRRSAWKAAGAATGGPWPFFMDNALSGGMQPMGL